MGGEITGQVYVDLGWSPTCDREGEEVIGVKTAHIVPSRTTSFAVPVSFKKQILAHSYVLLGLEGKGL